MFLRPLITYLLRAFESVFQTMFETFFTAKSHKKKISWQHAQGTVALKAGG